MCKRLFVPETFLRTQNRDLQFWYTSPLRHNNDLDRFQNKECDSLFPHLKVRTSSKRLGLVRVTPTETWVRNLYDHKYIRVIAPKPTPYQEGEGLVETRVGLMFIV